MSRDLRVAGTGEKIRSPHTTPQTIQVNWDETPKTYHAECNVGNCYWTSAKRVENGLVTQWARAHHRTNHTIGGKTT